MNKVFKNLTIKSKKPNKKNIKKLKVKKLKPIEDPDKYKPIYVNNHDEKDNKNERETLIKTVYQRGEYDTKRNLLDPSFDNDINELKLKIKKEEEEMSKLNNAKDIGYKKSNITKYQNKIKQIEKKRDEILHNNKFNEKDINVNNKRNYSRSKSPINKKVEKK